MQYKAAQRKKTINSLYLQNISNADVNVSDLGVMVKAGRTVNVFEFNPALTKVQVEKSLESGSAAHWIKAKLLRVVKKAVNKTPMILGQIRQSNKPMLIRYTKSSIIIHPESLLDEQDKQLDFADYDLDETAIKPTPAPIKNTDGTITVGPKETATPTRSIKAIAEGKDATENEYSADRIIQSEARILGEDGKEGELEASDEDGAIVMIVETK
jgi:hypothetical protein